MAKPVSHPFTPDCESICRIIDHRKKGVLYAGTAVLVSDQGRGFGYALTCWHNLALACVPKQCTLEGFSLLPRWARVRTTARRQPVTLVEEWSSALLDFVVLKIARKVIREFDLHPAPVSFDIYPGMELQAVGFPRPGELRKLDFIQGLKISNSDPLIKTRENDQRVFKVGSAENIAWDKGMSGGPLLYIAENDAVVVGLASFVKSSNPIGSEKWKGYGVPISVVATTWTDIANYCRVVRIIPRDTEEDRLRKSYLNRLFEETSRLSLKMVDPRAVSDLSDSEAMLSLDAVYTALLTLTPKSKDSGIWSEFGDSQEGRFSALEQLNYYPRLVLLGDPGSGKSTFVNFVSMCLAGAGLRKPQANLELMTAPLPGDDKVRHEKRQPWDHNALLPVRIILRNLAARGLPRPGQPVGADNVLRFIEEELGETLREYAPYLKKELRETGGLVLFDGLDEVPEADRRREQIKQIVEDFTAAFPRCRVLVTSRTYAYQNQKWKLLSFAEANLASFSDGQIQKFVESWYHHFANLQRVNMDDARGRAELLKRAIFGTESLRALAERPLLLTLMASLHAWRGGSLPEKREELYAEVLDLLLERWEQRYVVLDPEGKEVLQQESLQEFLRIGKDKVRRFLEELAFQVHSIQSDLVGTADIPAEKLAWKLLKLSSNKDVRAERLIEFLNQRAGVLVPRGVEVYTFVHRTFQEYMAACYLSDRQDFPTQAAELGRTDPDRWREVVLLAAAKAARGSAYSMWALVSALCLINPSQDGCGIEDVWGAHLSGLLLSETADLTEVHPSNMFSLRRVQKWLVQILERNLLPAAERVAAGNALSRIGDPRFRGDAWHLPAEKLLGFLKISKGQFTMGSDKKKDHRMNDNEIPQHRLNLPDYYIGRYPVTVAQFRVFVEAIGDQKKYKDSLAGSTNHPVVEVNWYDAVAYCEWLNKKLKDWEGTPRTLADLLRQGKKSAWRVTLPSEAEWEKAARSRGGRIFSWGGEADPNRANYSDTGIGTTSAVGCFAGGKSINGCLDMCGNVWEWTRSVEKKYPYSPEDGRELSDAAGPRVLRGGSFDSNENDLRCASRGRNLRGNAGRSYGFRVVLTQF